MTTNTLNRRAVLAGSAALLAATPAPAETEADIKTLAKQLSSALDAYDGGRWHAIVYPSRSLKGPVWLGRPVSVPGVEELDAELVTLGKEIEAAHVANASVAKALRALDAQGAKDQALEDEWEAGRGKLWDIGGRIYATPAKTLAGIMVKLRTNDLLWDQVDYPDDQVFVSIAADIRRLAGEDVS